MVILTAFADEISADLQEQLDTLKSEGIRHIEFRGVWGKNVLDLTDDELKQVRDTLQVQGFKISAVGSPIGKISITDDFKGHLKRLERAIEVAKYFETPYIRIFSFFIPEGEQPESYRDEVLYRMKEMSLKASEADVVLLHENEKEIYGDTAERCLDIFRVCPSEHLRCAFDPANFVQCGVKPYSEAFPLLDRFTDYAHIKDALFEGIKVVPAGQGDGEVKDVLQALFSRGYDGFLSLEPHLASAGKYQGFSGPELFHVAAGALKELLEELGQEWK